MATSPTEVTTVGEMIDAAITFNNDEPIVDFKMLEAVLYIIAKKLMVLERKVKVRHYDYNKPLSKMKSRLTVGQLKIHVITKATKGHTKRKSRTKKLSSSGQKRSPRFKSTHKSGKHKRELDEEQWPKVSSSSQGSQDHLSPIVTQEQYDELLSRVHQLQVKFGVKSTSSPSYISSNLHKQISLTEPMAAINLATRLEASNKKLNKMLEVVTKFAGDLPLKDPVELKLLFKSLEETPAFGGTSRTPSDANTATAETERVDDAVDEDRQADEICVENLATLSEFNVNMDEIRYDALRHISEAATEVTATAKRARTLLTEAGPKLSQALILGPKLRSRLEILDDHFTKVTDLDYNMTAKITDFQESVTNMRFDIDTVIESIFEKLAQQPEDPPVATALLQDFGEVEYQLYVVKDDQAALSERQKKSDALWLQRIRRLNKEINEVKTTRAEIVEALRNKLGINDINGLLSVNDLYAVVTFMQGKISQTKKHIESGEFNWQEIIDKCMTDLYEKCDNVQIVTLNNSLRNYCEFMSAKVETMLNIFGDYRVNIYKKKLDHKGNCLSCGTPADVKVSDKNMKFVKRMLNQEVKSKVLTQDDDAITQKPCVPGQPIQHPLDSRTLVCDRYCGASISKTRESRSSSLGVEVLDINLTRVADMPNKVHLTCIPCNHSQDSYVD